MANPKYADLPGIAVDQPDVYETTDLPESDQLMSDIVDESESVEKLNVSSTEAYEKFKDKTIDSSNADFSDKITTSRRTGYHVQSGNWEMVGDLSGESETPQQKYQRLQHEMRELFEEINQIKDDAKEDSDSSAESPIVLTKKVEALQKELMSINLEEVLGTDMLANMADPDGSLLKKLVTQIENFKQSKADGAAEGVSKSDVSSRDGNCVTYELFYKPEQSKFHQSIKAAELEQRLQKIENLIGKETSKFLSIVGETDHKNIVTAVRTLLAKLTLLDPVQLDNMEGRLTTLNQQLSQVMEKKSKFEDADKLNKVSEVYELLKKYETTCQTLPDVIDRLVSLDELHKQALQFSKALSELDNVQQQISASMKNNKKQLAQMEESFGKNMDIIKSNVTNLESRVSTLKK